MNLEHLIIVVVVGVIVADLVAHTLGTTTLFQGVGMLWNIGTQPTNTSLIVTSPAGTAIGKPISKKGA